MKNIFKGIKLDKLRKYVARGYMVAVVYGIIYGIQYKGILPVFDPNIIDGAIASLNRDWYLPDIFFHHAIHIYPIMVCFPLMLFMRGKKASTFDATWRIGDLLWNENAASRGTLISGGTGCMAKGYRIWKHDKTLVKVEDVRVGDALMGEDGQSRKVLRLNRGRSVMYKVIPDDGGKVWECNDVHIMTLSHVDKGNVDICLKDLLRDYGYDTGMGKRVSKDWKLFRKPIGSSYVDTMCGSSGNETTFRMEPMGEGDYYGFTLDGNGRFLLEDFTVTHNCGKTQCGINILMHQYFRRKSGKEKPTWANSEEKKSLDELRVKLDKKNTDPKEHVKKKQAELKEIEEELSEMESSRNTTAYYQLAQAIENGANEEQMEKILTDMDKTSEMNEELTELANQKSDAQNRLKKADLLEAQKSENALLNSLKDDPDFALQSHFEQTWSNEKEKDDLIKQYRDQTEQHLKEVEDELLEYADIPDPGENDKPEIAKEIDRYTEAMREAQGGKDYRQKLQKRREMLQEIDRHQSEIDHNEFRFSKLYDRSKPHRFEEYPWGGLCVDEKGLYWQTLDSMARLYNRRNDLLLLQTRPDWASDEWQPQAKFNLLSNDTIPSGAYANNIMKTSESVMGGGSGGGGNASFFNTQAETQIKWGIELLRAIRDAQLDAGVSKSELVEPSISRVYEIITAKETYDSLLARVGSPDPQDQQSTAKGQQRPSTPRKQPGRPQQGSGGSGVDQEMEKKMKELMTMKRAVDDEIDDLNKKSNRAQRENRFEEHEHIEVQIVQKTKESNEISKRQQMLRRDAQLKEKSSEAPDKPQETNEDTGEKLKTKRLTECKTHFRTQYWNQPKDQLGGVRSTIFNSLAFFMEPDIVEVFSSESTFDFSEIDRGKIIMVAMPQKYSTERRFVNTILKQLYYNHVLRRFDMKEEDLKKSNLLVLWQDEAQSFVIEKDGEVDKIREARATTIMATQSILSLYPPLGGKEKGTPIILNLRNRFIFRAADKECAKISADFIGERMVAKHSKTKSKGGGSTSISPEVKHFYEPHQLVEMPDFAAVICHSDGGHRKYIIAPLDKATGKVVFWWKYAIPHTDSRLSFFDRIKLKWELLKMKLKLPPKPFIKIK